MIKYLWARGPVLIYATGETRHLIEQDFRLDNGLKPASIDDAVNLSVEDMKYM